MASEFQSAISRLMGNALGILDPRGISREVSTEPVIPTINLDIGMTSYVPVVAASSPSLTGAAPTIFWPIVSPIMAPTPGTTTPLQKFPDNTNLETIILGFSMKVEILIVGDPANLKHVNVLHHYGTDPAVPVSIIVSRQNRWGYFDFAAPGKKIVGIAMGPSQQLSDATVISHQDAIQPIWVPAGRGYAIEFELDAIAATFGANCVVTTQAIGVQFPKGTRGPFL